MPRSARGIKILAGDLHSVGEVRAGGSYLSQNDLRVQFGLGDHTTLDKIVVRWPNGGIETFAGLAADRIYTIVEGKGIQESKRLSPPLAISSDHEQ